MKASIIGFLMGIGVAVSFIAVNRLLGIVFGSWTLWFWPSSIVLLASAGTEISKFSIASLLAAVLANGVLYAVIAFTIWRLVFARRG